MVVPLFIFLLGDVVAASTATDPLSPPSLLARTVCLSVCQFVCLFVCPLSALVVSENVSPPLSVSPSSRAKTMDRGDPHSP